MGYFQIGNFVVGNHLNSYRASWQHNGKRHHMTINLEAIIQNYIESHLADLANIIVMFESDAQQLMNHPKGSVVLLNTPEEEIPTAVLNNEESLKQWYREKLIQGYNRVYGTDINFDLIRERL